MGVNSGITINVFTQFLVSVVLFLCYVLFIFVFYAYFDKLIILDHLLTRAANMALELLVIFLPDTSECLCRDIYI